MIKTQKNAPTANMTAMDRTPSTRRNTKKRFTPETISRRINPTKATAMQERHARNESAGYLAENDGHLFGKRLCDQISEVIGTFSR